MNIIDTIKKILPKGFMTFVSKYTHSIIRYMEIRDKFLEDLRYIVDYHKSNCEWIEQRFIEYEKDVVSLLTEVLKKNKKD